MSRRLKSHNARTSQGKAKDGQRPMTEKLVVKMENTCVRPEVTHGEMDTTDFQTPSALENGMPDDMSV